MFPPESKQWWVLTMACFKKTNFLTEETIIPLEMCMCVVQSGAVRPLKDIVIVFDRQPRSSGS